MSESDNAVSAEAAATIAYNDCSVHVLHSTSLVKRIAKCARICYKGDSATNDDADSTLIKGCIKRGHESVLEHGAMSVYLPVSITLDGNHILNVMRDQKAARVIFRQEYEAMPVLSMRRWAHEFYDPDLSKTHMDDLDDIMKSDSDHPPILPVVMADIRAWRRICRERLFVSAQATHDPLSFVITVAVVNALYKAEPVFFEDIYEKINENLKGMHKDLESHDPMISCMFNKLPDDDTTVNGIIKTFFVHNENCIFAGEASPTAYITFIVTANRQLTHQLVRHRQDVGYSQESQRWINYEHKSVMNVIRPVVDPAKITENTKLTFSDKEFGLLDQNSEAFNVWRKAMEHAYSAYKKLVELGVPPETARGTLPNDCQTTIAVTWINTLGFHNFLYWRNEKHAQIQIRRIADEMLIFALTEPYGNMLDPSAVINCLTNIKDQHALPDATDENLDNLITEQKKRIEAINDYEKQQIEEFAKQQKAREEQEKSGIKVDDQHAVTPATFEGKRVVRVGGDANTPPANVEEVTERPATVSFENLETTEK